MGTKPKLKRTLGFPLVAMYGLGNILGAGIYVLVGKVAGAAGKSSVLAFLIAMLATGFTAFTYMELSSRYPVSASVSVYLHKAFGIRWLSVLVGLALVAGGITSAAALSQGFAGYLSSLVAVPTALASIGLIVVLGLIALKGIGESAKTAAVFTVLEVLGLLIVIWAGRSALGSVNTGELLSVDPSVGMTGVIAGAFLAFYAFIGFEDMVNVAEEVKHPRRTMPLAILTALGISTILYLLVVIVATAVVPVDQLANSEAPLTLVTEQSGIRYSSTLSYIGMIAAINGVIVQIIMGSRILYGLASQGWISNKLAGVNRNTHTPTSATLLVIGLMIAATIALPLISLAQVTSLLVLSIFALVNASLIAIKRSDSKHKSVVSIPLLVPYIGLVLCISITAYQIHTWL